MRVLGIELRRTSALVVGVLVALVMLGLLWWLPPANKNSTGWTRQFSTMAEWTRYLLIFTWPLTFGAGAVLGLRDRRSGVLELFSSTPLPRGRRVARTLLALGAPLVLAYAAVVAVGVVGVSSRTDYLSWGWVPVVLVGALSLVAAAWLGMGIGRLLPSPLTPPLVAVGAMALMVFAELAGTGGHPFALLRPVTAAPESVFTRVSDSVTAGQAAWFVGLAATGVLLVAARRWWLAGLPLVLGAAVALSLLPATAAGARAPDPAAAEVVCVDALCLTRAHEHERAALSAPARQALRLLSALPSPPTAVREIPNPSRSEPRGPEPVHTVWLDLDDIIYFRSEPLPPERLTALMVDGAGTRDCDLVAGPSGEESAARAVVSAWLTGTLEPSRYHGDFGAEVNTLAASAWDALRALPPADQTARVNATREALAGCTGSSWQALTGGSL
ncbi:hypothetical protein ACFPM7_15795 [Actinokineospora guangxiensis]|uniref:ABC transporter permease n=1 Tax=Actinokineospora guangxiensis TaxID=1490288 RepID=A0ABW0ER58_9PSEU